MPAPTVQAAILYRALRLSGVTMGPGRTPSPDQYSDALLSLNGFIDYLNAQPDAVFSVNNDSYVLSPPKLTYTIGIDPSGAVLADFRVPAPLKIIRANLVLAATPSVYVPLRMVDQYDYAALGVRQVPTTVPTVLYYDEDFPIAGLHLWGYPSTSNSLELWTWQALSTYATINDPVVLPPGYADMYVYNLAARLQDQFASQLQSPFNPRLQEQANRMLGRVKANNSTVEPMPSADFGTAGRKDSGGYFNYGTGQRA
jgi:hypothetical protein